MEAAVELGRELRGLPREEVRTTDVAHEESVPAEQRCRHIGPIRINHHVADVLRRVAGRVANLDAQPIDAERVALPDGHVLERAAAGPGGVDCCPGGCGQIPVAGHEVRVQMGLEDMRDPHTHLGRGVEVDVHVASRVHDRA